MAQDAVLVPVCQLPLVRIFAPRIEQLFDVKLQEYDSDEAAGDEGNDGRVGIGRSFEKSEVVKKRIVITTAPNDLTHNETLVRVKVR